MRARQAAAAGAILFLLSAPKVLRSWSPENLKLLYTVTPRYVHLAWITAGERFPQGAQILVLDRGQRRRLLNDFAATADPEVSFDGKRILFAGKRGRADHWQIWEVSPEGGDLRRITSCRTDCVRPFYLPEERLVYSRKVGGRFVIEVAPMRGGPGLALTYFPGNALATDVLRDGRILFQAGYPLGSGAKPEMYTVYSDGSGLDSYRCDHGKGHYSGRQVGSGDIVFARDGGLGRFTSPSAHEMQISAPAGEYAGDVAELPSGEWVVSRSADRTSSEPRKKIEAPNRQRVSELIRWKPGERASVVISDSGSHFVQPRPLAPRPVPNRHPSALHDWSYANLLCLNAYTSKYKFAEGSIGAVRLYTQDNSGRAQLLGSANVEKDGSFYLRTPADQPLKIELLDRNGKTLKKEAGWFWLRKGEQRICVGCHAGPEVAPENSVPIVLQRSTIAADMTRPSTPPSVQGGH